MRTWVLTLALIVSGLFSSLTIAHQLKSAETTILFNKNSGNIELMHRFYLHDTEHAAKEVLGRPADMLSNQADRDAFAAYVSKHVLMTDLAKNNMPLNLIGHEIDGKFLWVYQEAKDQADLKGIRLSHGALRDLWPTQINMVNIEGKGEVKTLYFKGDDSWHAVTF